MVQVVSISTLPREDRSPDLYAWEYLPEEDEQAEESETEDAREDRKGIRLL